MPKGGPSQACAACKFQRRKCTPECLLAPYFPGDKPELFNNVHRLFGVKMLVRTLESIPDPSRRAEAMTSMIYQANMRKMFPERGCCQVIELYRSQISMVEEELTSVYSQLEFHRSRAGFQVPTVKAPPWASTPVPGVQLPFYLDSKDNMLNPSFWIQSPCAKSNDKNDNDDFPLVQPQSVGPVTTTMVRDCETVPNSSSTGKKPSSSGGSEDT